MPSCDFDWLRNATCLSVLSRLPKRSLLWDSRRLNCNIVEIKLINCLAGLMRQWIVQSGLIRKYIIPSDLCKLEVSPLRILRSTLMVRVGGGWTALDEFLVKNDPCRVKGRTNLKIKEKYLFDSSRRGGSSKTLTVSRSNSSLSLYSSASAPSSPLTRKALLRRSLSGDRCIRPRSSIAALGSDLQFSTTGDDDSLSPSEEAERLPT